MIFSIASDAKTCYNFPGGVKPSGLLALISFQEMEKRGQQCDQRRGELEDFSGQLGLKLSASFLFSHFPHLLSVIYYTPNECICQYLEMLNNVKPREISAFLRPEVQQTPATTKKCNKPNRDIPRLQASADPSATKNKRLLCFVALFRCAFFLCASNKITSTYKLISALFWCFSTYCNKCNKCNKDLYKTPE